MQKFIYFISCTIVQHMKCIKHCIILDTIHRPGCFLRHEWWWYVDLYTHTLSFFFSLSLSTLSLMHSLSLVLPRSLSLSLCLSFYDISWMKSNFLLSLIEKHLCFDVWKSTYLLKHTPSHTVSSISPITQMSHKHPVQLKKTQKSHSNTLYGALWHCHNAWKKK